MEPMLRVTLAILQGIHVSGQLPLFSAGGEKSVAIIPVAYLLRFTLLLDKING